MSEEKKINSNNELIRIIIYPLLIVFFFLVYNKDFTKIIQNIAERTEKASKVSVAGISFEIEKSAIKLGDEKIAKKIANLSNGAIKLLIKIGQVADRIVNFTREGKGIKEFSINSEFEYYKELEKAEFVQPSENITELQEYFFDLKPKEYKVFGCLNGSRTLRPSFGCEEEIIVYSINTRNLSDEQIQRFKNVEIRKTTEGINAYHVIIDALLNDLKK